MHASPDTTSTISGRFEIVRHPDYNEINPFDVIHIPLRDLKSYKPQALIVFAKGCQKIYRHLDHPNDGLGINPTRIAEVNNAVSMLDSSDISQIESWAKEFLERKVREDSKLQQQVSEQILRLTAISEDLEDLKHKHTQDFANWFREQFKLWMNGAVDEAFKPELEFDTPHLIEPSLSLAVDRLKSIDKSVLTHSTLAEDLILNGEKNPFDLIPVTESLLDALIRNKDQISIKESLGEIKRPILKLFHPDVTSNETDENFIRICDAFKTIENLSDSSIVIIAQSYLQQQRKIKTESNLPLVSKLTQVEALVNSKFNDLLSRVQIYKELRFNLINLADKANKVPGTQRYQNLMFFIGRAYPVIPGESRLSMRSTPNPYESHIYLVDKDGVLYRSSSLSSNIDASKESQESLAKLVDSESFIACGYLCGSIARIARDTRELPYIGSAALSIDCINLLEGVSMDVTIPLSDEDEGRRSVKPLLFISSDPEMELVVLHPYHSFQYKQNLDKYFLYQVARSKIVEILDRECALKQVRKYSFSGCEVEIIRGQARVQYKSKDKNLVWNIDKPQLDSHTESDLELLVKLLDALQPIYMLKKTILLCNKLLQGKPSVVSEDKQVFINVGSKHEKQILSQRMQGMEDYLDPTQNLEVQLISNGKKFKLDLLVDLRALQAGISSLGSTHAIYARIHAFIKDHFKDAKTIH